MQNIQWSLPIGALPDQNGVRFRVWAASASRVEVVLYDDEGETGVFALAPEGDGYFAGQFHVHSPYRSRTRTEDSYLIPNAPD